MTFKGFIRNRQETIGILGLLLIVLSLTGLLGCPSPTPSVRPDITGEFSYLAGVSALVESNEISTSPKPTWTGRTDDDQTVEYSITARPNGADAANVTVDTEGVVTITAQALVESSGTYTVTATGIGVWQGTKTATIEVTIKKQPEAITGEFIYLDGDPIIAVEGTAKTSPKPTWKNITDDKQTVAYSITTRPDGADEAHVKVDTATGVVTVTEGARAESEGGEYTVTATGTGAYIKDAIKRETTVQITIHRQGTTSITGTLSYGANIDTTFGTAKTQEPSWSGHNTDQTVTYSIAPAKNGISIDQATGEVTVAGTAPLSTGTYTVTATGYKSYKDSITADITITIGKAPIAGTLSYDAIETAVGTAKTQTPRWSPHNTAQTVTYSIAPAKNGISIDQATGEITVASTAPLSTGTYTVTADGAGNYEGTKTATLTITIAKISIAGTLSYDSIETEVGIAKTQTPGWSDGHNTDQTVTYSIAPATNGISIDQATGEVSVAGTAPTTSSGTYTVTVTGTGDYGGDDIIGTITVAIQDAGATSITGTLSYDANIDTTFGIAKTQTPSWSGHNTGQTVTYSIAPTKDGISIDQATGKVSVAGTAPTTSSGAYTVTATGYGDYKDSRTADITITIAKKAITGTLSYDAIETAVGTAKNQTASWSGHNTAQTVTYSIAPAKDGISIDQATGEITVANTAPVSTGTYTVTADGAGNYEGRRTATLTITIAKISIIGTLSYEAIETAVGTAKNQTPSWSSGHNTAQTVTYSIAPAKNGISIDQATGEITVASTAPVSTGTYTVTADGAGNYEGTRTATLTITIAKISITGTLYYEAIETAVGIAKTQTPSWSGHNTGQTVTYSITPTKNGISIDQATGEITVSNTAPGSTGAYTITATGIGDFQGTITATITITVEAKDIGDSFSYNGLALSAVEGNAGTGPMPDWTEADPGQTVEYSITNRPGAADPAHVTINTATGVLRITEDALVASSGEYTVTATGTGAFKGTRTATIQITITAEAKDIGGTFYFRYLTVRAFEGTARTIPQPTWREDSEEPVAEPVAGQTVEYSITNRPPGVDAAHVTVETATGKLTITEDARAASSGEYTVTATGTGAFKGTRIATIQITIVAVEAITGRFTYKALSALKEYSWTSRVEAWIGATAGQTVEYSITKRPTGADAAYVTVHRATGAVTVQAGALKANSGEYTITATGIVAFQGTITATITITADAEGLSGEFTYAELTVLEGTARTSPMPAWTIEQPGRTVEYSITTRPDGVDAAHVTVNTVTGEITVTKDALVASSGDYVITATGIGDFTSARFTTINITIKTSTTLIDGELTYYDPTTAAGSPMDVSPGWRDENNVFFYPTYGDLEYSIAPPAGNAGTGVTVDKYDGTVKIDSTVTVASAGLYKITAKGVGAFSGTIEATIDITINEFVKQLGGSFSYEDITMVAGGQGGSDLKWGSSVADDQRFVRNVKYSIAIPDGSDGLGVRIDHHGNVRVDSPHSTVATSGTYTVTATGMAAYGGTLTSTVTIIVTAN